MYASTSARRASASIRRAPSRTSSSITDDAADRAAPEPSRSAESETTVSIGSYLPDQRLPRRSSLEPSIGHPGRYAPSQADPQISSIALDLYASSDETIHAYATWHYTPGVVVAGADPERLRGGVGAGTAGGRHRRQWH